MTSLYQMLNSAMQINQYVPQQMFQNQNMFQRINEFMRAMQNPAEYVRQKFPDIPEEIKNDPNQILSYLKKTRGITDQQIQQQYGDFINK